MADFINSPNMNLPVPTVGVASGPEWAQDVNSSLTLIDQHNHTPGQGVQIPPAGLNINTALPFNNQAATGVQAVVLQPQVSYTTDYGLHAEGVDLYFVDGNGNDVQITSGGSVNATSSGISSGTATASFAGGALVVNSASNTPANIQAASYLMGNNVANSKYLTIQPPNSMAANYSVTMPTIPASQSFLTIDTSGNIAPYASINQGILQTNLAAPNTAISSSCGNFSTSSTSFVAVTNLVTTITTTGRPVWVGLTADGSLAPNTVQSAGSLSPSVGLRIVQGSVTIFTVLLLCDNLTVQYPVSAFYQINFLAAGTYTFRVQAAINNASNSAEVNNAKLLAYEL